MHDNSKVRSALIYIGMVTFEPQVQLSIHWAAKVFPFSAESSKTKDGSEREQQIPVTPKG